MSLTHTKQYLHEAKNYLEALFENTQTPYYKKYLLTSLLSLRMITLIVLVDFPDELTLVLVHAASDVKQINRRFKQQPNDSHVLTQRQHCQNALLLAFTSVMYPLVVICRALSMIRSFVVISFAMTLLGALSLALSIPAALLAAGNTLKTRYAVLHDAESLSGDLSDADSYRSLADASPKPKTDGFFRCLVKETGTQPTSPNHQLA